MICLANNKRSIRHLVSQNILLTIIIIETINMDSIYSARQSALWKLLSSEDLAVVAGMTAAYKQLCIIGEQREHLVVAVE